MTSPDTMESVPIPSKLIRYGDMRTITRFFQNQYGMFLVESTLEALRFVYYGESFAIIHFGTGVEIVRTLVPETESAHFHQIMSFLKVYWEYACDPFTGKLQRRQNEYDYYPRLVNGLNMLEEQDEFLDLVDAGFSFALARGFCHPVGYFRKLNKKT